jgi:hypothetical protein
MGGPRCILPSIRCITVSNGVLHCDKSLSMHVTCS